MLLALILLVIVVILIAWRLVQVENKIVIIKNDIWAAISNYHSTYHRDLIVEVKKMIAEFDRLK